MIDVSELDYAPDIAPDSWFWEQRPILAHILAFARARRVSPYAALACVLRRAISCVEPHVKLPPTIGGVASVNFATVTVGRSGLGKGASDAAGRAAVIFPDNLGGDLDAPSPSIGSGEGLARLFSGSKQQPPITRAHIMVAEVLTLAALAGRQGATLAGELLKALMGEQIGFNNAQRETTTVVAAHAYRLCLGVGAQPENADFFLQREKDGFPQRFLWAPASDPYAPLERPDPVDPITVIIPDFGSGEDRMIDVPETVRAEIDAFRHPVLTGSDDVDPLDGHLMLTRLKVAFGLALLEGRADISVDDWRVAGQLIDVSVRTREDVRTAVAEKRRKDNRAKANDQAQRQVIVETRLTEDRQARVGKAIVGKLRRVGRANRSDLRRGCNVDLRSDFDPVLETLVDKGFLTVYPGEDGRSDEYAIADK